jgi:hypothetical protein
LNCTPATPLLSAAHAETVIVPETAAPDAGETTETVGGLSAGTAVPTTILTCEGAHGAAEIPRAESTLMTAAAARDEMAVYLPPRVGPICFRAKTAARAIPLRTRSKQGGDRENGSGEREPSKRNCCVFVEDVTVQ